jgi:hypothetical protein
LQDEDEYDDPDYEYTSPGNTTSDSSRFHLAYLLFCAICLLALP